jgi:ferredoxin-type protein NapG
MDRRDFFRTAFRKTTEKVVEYAEAKVEQQAQHWIRPPYAINEFDFLISCTRCTDCIEACPHDVIFPLSKRVGIKATKTPALDLLNKACHLCADWPCVNACKEGALAFPQLSGVEQEVSENLDRPLPLLASASINTQACFPYSGPECGACNICPVPGALVWDQQRPSINEEKCVGCGLCREACIVEPSAISMATRSVEKTVA